MQFFQAKVNTTQALRYEEGLRVFMVKVFNQMSLGLVFTGVISWLFANVPVLMSFIYVIDPVTHSPAGATTLGLALSFAPLIFAFIFGPAVNRLSASGVTMMFYLFSALLGVSLSYIFLMYTSESIARTFFITAAMFGSMALYGNTTKKDLTSFGSFLIMGLFGVIIASVVNIFLHSSALSFAMSFLSIFIFMGMTAFDVQKIKSTYLAYSGASEDVITKIAVYSAFSLYLDFINLFTSLLRFIGDRRN
jgi:FtsH-binding integral membrane protein